MRRFFGNVDTKYNEVTFNQETLNHMKVIRLKLKEKIEVVSQGHIYVGQVVSYQPFKVQLIEEITQTVNRELNTDVILLCPLLKKDNFELTLQKATELGVKEIYPYLSSRVIKRVDKDDFNAKKERFEKILLNASEQSNRTFIPTLHDLEEYEDVIKEFDNTNNKFIAYEDEALKGELLPLNLDTSSKVVVLFGPEGGFSKEEVKLAQKENFKLVSLGKRILRAETASFYLLSVVSFLIERSN